MGDLLLISSSTISTLTPNPNTLINLKQLQHIRLFLRSLLHSLLLQRLRRGHIPLTQTLLRILILPSPNRLLKLLIRLRKFIVTPRGALARLLPLSIRRKPSSGPRANFRKRAFLLILQHVRLFLPLNTKNLHSNSSAKATRTPSSSRCPNPPRTTRCSRGRTSTNHPAPT